MDAQDMVAAAVRTVEGIDRVVELRASDAEMVRCLVTEERQSTTVPNTSVKSALGGLVVDMVSRGANR